MRKKKHSEERLFECKEYILPSPTEPMKNPAKEVFSADGKPVFLEIGAGKGGFACGMVKAHPEVCYFAMERVTDCVVIAAEGAKKSGCVDNLRFILDTADNLTRIFEVGTVDEIFLNFSDPWPKKGYAKRRLTHKRYLSVYLNLLKDGGRLTFKTDNLPLFEFSLEEIEAVGITPDRLTRDLHQSEYNEGNVVTEYEAAFSSRGVKINMVSFVKPDGFAIEVPDNLKKDRKDYRREND